MKKFIAALMLLLCLALMTACGKTADSGTENSSEDTPVQTLSTPYAELKIPADYQGKVGYEVTAEDPYTLVFQAEDGTELYTLYVNHPGELLIGTLIGEKANAVFYADIPDLDEKSDHYSENLRYQEEIDVIVSHLTAEYEFAVNQVVAYDDHSTFAIETTAGTLYYPQKWKDQVQVETTDHSVTLSCEGTKLFDLVFEECDGSLLGQYHSVPIYVCYYDIAEDDYSAEEYQKLCAMQEDVNVILEHLMEDSAFTLRVAGT